MSKTKTKIGAIDRRERLIESAIKLFSENPYEDVAVQDIAVDADVATGLLYYHFTDKQGLYAAALEALADRLKEALDNAADPKASPLDRLTSTLRAQLDLIAQNPAGYRELLGGVASQPKVKSIVERERSARLELVSESLPPDVPNTPAVRTTLEGWLHFADGVQLAWLENPEIPGEEIVELCVAVLMASVDAAKQLNGKPVKRAAKPKRRSR